MPKKLQWLAVEHCSVFETATLLCKFLHTGFPKYFAPYLSSYSSSYITRHSQSGGNFLAIPKFYPTIHKLSNSYSFPFDAPNVWNALPFENVHPPLSESSLKPTGTPRYSHLRLNYPLAFCVVFWFC